MARRIMATGSSMEDETGSNSARRGSTDHSRRNRWKLTLGPALPRSLLLRPGYHPRLHQIPLHRHVGRDVRFPQSVRVRSPLPSVRTCPSLISPPNNSDFFPVVISFLRQVPGIGAILSLPVVRQVRCRNGGALASHRSLQGAHELSSNRSPIG